MWKVTAALLVAVCVGLPTVHSELKCYTCIMTGSDKDQSCLTNPTGVSTGTPITTCKLKYCSIIRTEYLDPAGDIFTFTRGCTSYSDDGITDGGGYRTYTRICTKSLCNDWDGISGSGGSGGSGSGGSGSGSGGGGGAGNGDPGYDGVIMAPGTGNGAADGRSVLSVALVLVAVVTKLMF